MEYSRIAKERKKLKLSQEELAEKINISPKSVSSYERGSRRPSYETLTTMAALFHVSTDYLLGNSNIRENDGSVPCSYFKNHWENYQERLRAAMAEFEISNEAFQKQLGFSAEQEPSIDDLIKLSATFHISVDYLLGLSMAKSTSARTVLLSHREQNVIETLRRLNVDNRDIIIGEIKKMLKEQRAEESAAIDKLP